MKEYYISCMKYFWRIRRLFLRRDIKELIDRYSDDQEYLAPDIVGIGKVTKKTISDAQSQGLVKRNTRNTEFGKMRVISLTKKKGLPLSRAKYMPNWEKIAALVGIATLIFTLLAFAYQIYTANSVVTSSYTFAYTESTQNLDKLKEAGVAGHSRFSLL